MTKLSANKPKSQPQFILWLRCRHKIVAFQFANWPKCHHPLPPEIPGTASDIYSIFIGVPATFARLTGASFVSHLLAPPPRRAGLSSWLALLSGLVSHWLSSHFLEYSPRNSFGNLKQHCSAAHWIGTLLSSPT